MHNRFISLHGISCPFILPHPKCFNLSCKLQLFSFNFLCTVMQCAKHFEIIPLQLLHRLENRCWFPIRWASDKITLNVEVEEQGAELHSWVWAKHVLIGLGSGIAASNLAIIASMFYDVLLSRYNMQCSNRFRIPHVPHPSNPPTPGSYMHCCRAWAPVKHKSCITKVVPVMMLNSYYPMLSCPIVTYAILSHPFLYSMYVHLCTKLKKHQDCALFTLYCDIFGHQLQLAVTLACFQPTIGSWVQYSVMFSETYWSSKSCSGKLCLKQWANTSQTLWHSAI